MSTFAYAAPTNRRDASPKEKSEKEAAPGVSRFVDATAALVPAEVLVLHAAIISYTTEKVAGVGTSPATTSILNPELLQYSFFGLILFSVLLYYFSREKKLRDKYDFIRACIPPFAFVAWTMLQRITALDAVAPSVDDATRMVIALFLASVLVAASAKLAKSADTKDPPNDDQSGLPDDQGQ